MHNTQQQCAIRIRSEQIAKTLRINNSFTLDAVWYICIFRAWHPKYGAPIISLALQISLYLYLLMVTAIRRQTESPGAYTRMGRESRGQNPPIYPCVALQLPSTADTRPDILRILRSTML